MLCVEHLATMCSPLSAMCATRVIDVCDAPTSIPGAIPISASAHLPCVLLRCHHLASESMC